MTPTPRPARSPVRPLGRLLRAALLCAGLVAGVVPAAGCTDPEVDADDRRIAATGPEAALAWSELAWRLAWEEDQFLTFKGQRALAMMHLAVHDALQAVVPVYRPWRWEGDRPDADPLAAATSAAYEVLIALYPDRATDLDAARSDWLARTEDGAPRTLGVEAGRASARAALEAREGDGWDEPGTYTFREGPGQYRTTPPWDGFTLQQGFALARPFSFDDPTAFRPPPPPDLTSPAYAAALDEVRLQGDSASTVRTADQTGYAVWWMEFSEGLVGRVARELLRERGTDLWTANRVLAHLYVALFDGYVSNWDSKYHYNHWRPYTAVRAADEDGNAATHADPDWVPLRTTPPFPEYASAHATGCAAAFEVLALSLGDAVAFEATSLTAPPGMPTRAFTGFRSAAAECGDSRVQLGWHYRYAVDAGLEAGRRVAGHVVSTLLAAR